ncbi:LIn-26 Related [Caenorhabditis elegans]|uniref:LIn-26 Related n=4 Tax=Caenorhabditis elegans TaxID=6239 RepID=H2KYA2_CAEEL|nr:LIn-26 Related [Caenorhabditis elegans]CCD62038.1 LIn-26 Related [Caenorhabditis elegans]|eukprot:NP_001022096.1 LIn-26 Related [Caenorhabditis elegans]
MPKFVVIELNDDAATIDLLSYCVKKNFERVSLLTRLEDHPYLRDDQDVVQDDTQSQGTDGMLLQLNDEERQRLMKMISTPGPQTLSMERIQMAPGQGQHILQQHQIPSTSSYTNNSFIYIKSDPQYKDEPQQQSNQFDATVNSVAHGQAGLSTLEMFACNGSPNGGDVLRRKTPSRKAEDSIKATCKVCGHDVMYSPQRTWNLMRHVWIMHQSSKPNQCSICGYSHIKPYVRKHIESQHKHDSNATIIDLKSPELEAEWSQLLDQCFGVTYRKWKHHKEDTQHTGGLLFDDDELRGLCSG